MTEPTFSEYYAARSKEAADRQGITAIADALTAVGVSVEIEQTGGFIMVAYVRPTDGRIIALNDDGGINVSLFDSEEAEWNGEDATVTTFDTPAEAAAHVTSILNAQEEWVVTYISMPITASSADEAIAMAEGKGGGHWEARRTSEAEEG